MKLESSRQLPVDVATAWAALNDLDVLKRCIPGCDSLERRPDGLLLAVVTARIGPVSAKFTGTVEILDVIEREGYRLQFSGQGAAAGFAKGEAKVVLRESSPSTTELAYTAEASVGGKLAQIGSRLVEASARKLAEDFFSRLEAEFDGRRTASEVAPTATANVPPSEAATHRTPSVEEASPARRRARAVTLGAAACALVVAFMFMWLMAR